MEAGAALNSRGSNFRPRRSPADSARARSAAAQERVDRAANLVIIVSQCAACESAGGSQANPQRRDPAARPSAGDGSARE